MAKWNNGITCRYTASLLRTCFARRAVNVSHALAEKSSHRNGVVIMHYTTFHTKFLSLSVVLLVLLFRISRGIPLILSPAIQKLSPMAMAAAFVGYMVSGEIKWKTCREQIQWKYWAKDCLINNHAFIGDITHKWMKDWERKWPNSSDPLQESCSFPWYFHLVKTGAKKSLVTSTFYPLKLDIQVL